MFALLFILGPLGSWHVAAILGLILVLVTIRQRRRTVHLGAPDDVEARIAGLTRTVRRKAIWKARLRHPLRG